MNNASTETVLKDVITRSGALLRDVIYDHFLIGRVQTGIYDRMINDFIIDTIKEIFPSHHFISEQGPIDHLCKSGFTWVIDPIDGSDNFERGILAYSISISLFHNNEIILGSVFEPYVDRLFFAAKGRGATLNGQRLHVSSVSNLAEALVATSSYNSFITPLPNGQSYFQRLVECTKVRISASTALDMCYVASGSLDARIMADTKIWDNAAASLLVREAGGRVTDWKGNEQNYESSQLVASNTVCHQSLLELLRSGGQ